MLSALVGYLYLKASIRFLELELLVGRFTSCWAFHRETDCDVDWKKNDKLKVQKNYFRIEGVW